MYPVSKRTTYDRAATMFSPDGRLYQVEYASKIVEQGTIGVAVIYKNGIFFGADKKVQSKLLIPGSIEKLFKIDEHAAVISAGLVGDARRLVAFARQEAQENRLYYEEPIQIETLAKRIASIKQIFTQYAGMRPFGVSLIIGGYDNSGCRLFETEPSGALAEYKAIAIGKGKKEAMDYLEKNYKENLSLEAAAKLVTKTIEKSLAEKEKFDISRVTFAFINKEEKFKYLSAMKVKQMISKK